MKTGLCEAIHKRKVLELRYSGYSRIVEPYTYGLSKDGDGLLRCYQVGGGSESGERTGWKLLKVDEIFMLAMTDKSFELRPEYRKGDKAMERILCEQ